MGHARVDVSEKKKQHTSSTLSTLKSVASPKKQEAAPQTRKWSITWFNLCIIQKRQRGLVKCQRIHPRRSVARPFSPAITVVLMMMTENQRLLALSVIAQRQMRIHKGVARALDLKQNALQRILSRKFLATTPTTLRTNLLHCSERFFPSRDPAISRY